MEEEILALIQRMLGVVPVVEAKDGTSAEDLAGLDITEVDACNEHNAKRVKMLECESEE